MQTILKILLVVSLFAISYQDFKERSVYVWGGVVSAMLLGLLHCNIAGFHSFLISIAINSVVIVLILLILLFYAKYKLNIPLSQSLGYGDMLFFFAMGLSFPSFTFLIVFVFSLFFTGIMYIVLKNHISKNQIPLAGFQALFLILIFLTNWSFQFTNLYLF